MVFLCKGCFDEVTNLSKGMEYGAVVESIISVTFCESFILCDMFGDWYGTWVARGFCYLGVYDGRIESVFVFCFLVIKW